MSSKSSVSESHSITSNRNNEPIDEDEKWKPKTTLIAGDSMLLGIDESRISANRKVKVRCFRGAKVNDMYDYLNPLLKKCPDNIILHIATNDTVKKTSRTILNEILSLKTFIKKKYQRQEL